MPNTTDHMIGKRVRTLYEHSEAGTIVRPRRANLPLPGPDWFIIRFDDGQKACINRSMFALANG